MTLTPPRDMRVGDEGTRLGEAPALLRALDPAIEAFRATLPGRGPIGFVGCGSSLDVPQALAAAVGARAVSASETLDDEPPGEATTWIAVTRSGGTRELLELLPGSAIRHVITCDPDAAVPAALPHVLDLSAAADSGFVAALSALVTAGAIARLLGDDAGEVAGQIEAGLGDRSRGAELPAGAPVAWLGPWAGLPLGREATRKAIETGRPSTSAHLYEFLHGEDQMFRGGTRWVVIDTADRRARLRASLAADDAERLVEIPFDWRAASPAELTGLLARIYRMLF